jgi:hypothetical protein
MPIFLTFLDLFNFFNKPQPAFGQFFLVFDVPAGFLTLTLLTSPEEAGLII